MSKTLVFEIGTEEMPANPARDAVDQLRVNAERLFTESRLKEEGRDADFKTYGTPRRLVLVVRELAERQSPSVESVKGPPKQAAYAGDGSPTPAAIGFAKSQGVEVPELEIRDVGGRDYVFAVKEHPGQAAETVLTGLLPQLVLSLEFPKAMRWGSGQLRFIRPIRWLLALYGDRVVPVELDGLVSGRRTFGHRFLADGPFEIRDADAYQDVLAGAKVVIDGAAREAAMTAMLDKAAVAAGGRAAVNPDVLREVVYLVEDPHVVVGGFDREFLDIPRAVVVTAMESHQRYFPIEDAKGGLMPAFAVVHNGDPVFDRQISHGHERVLRARLADAAFFFHEDTKTSLESKVDRLKGVVWQAKLGTLYEKTQRMRALGAAVSDLLGLTEKQKLRVDRALFLLKADLTSSMVIEFTDLQGIVGGEYALIDGEDAEVSRAVGEHYRPRFAGDEPPETVVGRVAALCDKLDSIVGCFLVGLIPTGSADPYSLRRQAAGIIAILAEAGWPVGLRTLVGQAMDNYAKVGIATAEPEEIAGQLGEFLFARVKRWLVDLGRDLETIDAVLAAGFDRVDQIAPRVSVIGRFKGKKELEDIKLAFTRCQNLSRPELGSAVAASLLEAEEEQALYNDCQVAKEKLERIITEAKFDSAVELLASMRGPIDRFFDAVLVMAPDEKVRSNRLRLLNFCLSVSKQVADFSKLP